MYIYILYYKLFLYNCKIYIYIFEYIDTFCSGRGFLSFTSSIKALDDLITGQSVENSTLITMGVT